MTLPALRARWRATQHRAKKQRRRAGGAYDRRDDNVCAARGRATSDHGRRRLRSPTRAHYVNYRAAHSYGFQVRHSIPDGRTNAWWNGGPMKGSVRALMAR